MTADPTGGYWTASSTGSVTSYGGAGSFGSPALSGVRLSQPIVGMAATSDGQGYWLVASDGGVFSFGDAKFYGSTGAIHLNRPIVGMSPTSDGKGYLLVASDGGIFTFGDAKFFGSTGAMQLKQPVVGMAVTSDGKGYWLVASDGGIFTFGDAKFFGSTGAMQLAKPIVGMAPTSDGQGYWLVASDGGVFTYGDAKFDGSTGGGSTTVLGILVSGSAYTLVGTSGNQIVPTLAPPATSVAPGGLLQGAYAGPANPSGVAAFDAATGTQSQIATEYLPSNSGWSGMDGAGGTLSWLTGAWAGKGYTLSVGVPIIPTNSSGAAVGSLATGATGAYNSYFVTLAQTLIAGGEGNAYLRLGWEFDGNWFPSWSARTPAAEADFGGYFDQIVTAMRSVPGENFKFVWNPDVGAFAESGYNVTLAYPGNAYVNVIGVDAYDETWASPRTPATAWNVTLLPALNTAESFAAAQGKPFAVCEWGIAFLSNGLGDDPLYVDSFAAWMKNPANNVLYESYFNYAGTSDSVLTSGSTPNSLAAFKADLG
jgi:ribosomal protein L24E